MSSDQLPDATIVETTVLLDEDGVAVRIQISDEPLKSERAPKFHLTLSVRLPHYTLPLFAQLEREALDLADSVLVKLVRDKTDQLGDGHRPVHPSVR